MVSDVDCCLSRELHGYSNDRLCSHIYSKGETAKGPGPSPYLYRNSHKVGQSSRPTVLYKQDTPARPCLLSWGAGVLELASRPQEAIFSCLSPCCMRKDASVHLPRGFLLSEAGPCLLLKSEMNGLPALSPRPTAGL